MNLRTGLWCIAIALAGFLVVDLVTGIIFQLADTIGGDDRMKWFEYTRYPGVVGIAFALLGVIGGILCAAAPTRLRIWFVLFAVALALDYLLMYSPWLLQKADVRIEIGTHDWIRRGAFLMWTGATAMFALAAYRWAKPALVWTFIGASIAVVLFWFVGEIGKGEFGRRPDWQQWLISIAGDVKRCLWIVVVLDMLGGFRARGDTTVGPAARTATIAIAIGMCVVALAFAVIVLWSASKVGADLPLRDIVTAALYIGAGVFALVWRRAT